MTCKYLPPFLGAGGVCVGGGWGWGAWGGEGLLLKKRFCSQMVQMFRFMSSPDL